MPREMRLALRNLNFEMLVVELQKTKSMVQCTCIMVQVDSQNILWFK